MKKYRMKRWVALLLTMTILCLAVGCGSGDDRGESNYPISSENLMSGVKSSLLKGSYSDCDCAPVEMATLDPQITDFAVRLFQSSMEEGKNTLISPVSVLTALAMTANGADGETLAQMEEVLGIPKEDLNHYIESYMEQLPEEDTYKLSLANSIWFKDDEEMFQVNEDFLQLNANYYDADIYKAPFDESTLTDINNWVKNETDEMIPTILDRIPEDAIMYLVNALAFDAKWQEPYEDYQVRNGVFTTEEGAETDVTMMHSEEYAYLEDDMATGFIKYYDDRAYAFAALLPDEGITVEEYVASLTGEHLHEMLSNPEGVPVFATMPKFESEYDVELSDVLQEMGMVDAFDAIRAEFPYIGTVSDGLNIVISRVIHKTFISVTENGTQAGAATVVEMRAEGAAEMIEYRTVTLDRPFVYMLIDCENNIPLFIGTAMTVE